MQPGPEERSRVIIVGAGPIGLELAVSLKRAGVSVRQFDAHQIGHTFTWWPRNTRFFSTAERIAIAGFPIQSLDQEHITGEAYLAYLRTIVEQVDLHIQTYEPVLSVKRDEAGFQVRTRKAGKNVVYHSELIILAVGDMHAPRMLGIPGEDLPHVTHYFTEPHLYFRKELLIVGGRNSAVEAALRCFRAGARVTLSYRKRFFGEEYVKPFLLPDVQAQIKAGNIQFLPESEVVEIMPGSVELIYPGRAGDDKKETRSADFVLLCTGFEAEQHLLEEAGVRLTGDNLVPEFHPETMETNVDGLYVAGTTAAGKQSRYTVFIENSHQHVGRIVEAITGNWPESLGTIPGRQVKLPFDEFKRN